MIIEQSQHIIDEVSKVFIGKDEIIKKVLMTIYAGGHILLNDAPGTGKTTLALAFSKALGLDYKRIQFTTDTLPSDIVGFTMLNNETQKFEFRPGAVFSNLLLADEINRTSPKTQAALLEAMEEHNVTVDGVTYDLPHPFITIATQNPMGSAGTQPLPESQLDRFMICLSIGYPNLEKQIEIIKSRRYDNPIERIEEVASKENVIEVQNYLSSVRISDDVLKYIVLLCEKTREMPLVELGVSPRGVLALVQMAKAHAVLEDRIYVIPEDVQYVFLDVCAHRMMSMPHGIIYVTGPTGSGKTTTLYMILEKLAQGQINISTIEDPVERKLNRINQMQVNTMSGLTFDRGLRALMRQDPDVIMVGETRDKETAEISVRAAITGHLVVSTLHTNDAISTIVRLEEMGVEPYMVANSLVGVVAQRLMRKVCPYCKKEVATSLSDRLALQEGIKYISKGTGCPHCNQTGYKGRIAIHEVIEIDSKVRKMISNQEEIDDIMKYLVEEQGVETLRDQALKLVKEGKTTVDEFNKIIAYID